MELVVVEATQLSELINTVRELKDTVKQLLNSAISPKDNTPEGWISRVEAMKYLHIATPGKWIIACKRYDFKMRKIGKKKLFQVSHLEQVLKEKAERQVPLTYCEGWCISRNRQKFRHPRQH